MAEIITLPSILAKAVAYYRMESGALTTDSKGNGHTLTNNGTVGETTGKYGGGSTFGASNSSKYFDRASDLGVNIAGDYSFTMWTKWLTEATATGQFFFEHFSTTTANRYLAALYIELTGVKTIRFDFSGTSIDYAVTLGTASYHHIALTCSAAGAAKVYFDGAEVTTGTRGSGTGGVQHLWIGSNQGGSNYSSNELDEVGIFNSVLSPTEIGYLYGLGPGSSMTMMMV